VTWGHLFPLLGVLFSALVIVALITGLFHMIMRIRLVRLDTARDRIERLSFRGSTEVIEIRPDAGIAVLIAPIGKGGIRYLGKTKVIDNAVNALASPARIRANWAYHVTRSPDCPSSGLYCGRMGRLVIWALLAAAKVLRWRFQPPLDNPPVL